jgi:hypothetical protein
MRTPGELPEDTVARNIVNDPSTQSQHGGFNSSSGEVRPRWQKGTREAGGQGVVEQVRRGSDQVTNALDSHQGG